MKTRLAFVSNSSSTSFIIKNTTNEKRTLLDFLLENQFLIDEYNAEYYDGAYNYNLCDMINSLNQYNYVWGPNESLECGFGDNDGNPLGRMYDYMLRDGGKTESFEWNFHEYSR